jgi:hypothetical protein
MIDLYLNINVRLFTPSISMLLSPVQHPVVAVAALVEQVPEQTTQPSIVRLLLELESAHVLEVLTKFIYIKPNLPGNPPHSRDMGTDSFFYFTPNYLSSSSLVPSSHGNFPFRKYISMYPRLSKSSRLPVSISTEYYSF